MANQQLSEESKEKIEMVFRSYAVSPVENRIDNALKALEKKLVNSDNEDCLETRLFDKAGSISTSVSRIKEGTDDIKTSLNQTIQSIGNLENRLVNTDTKDSLKNVLLGQAKDISSSIQGVKSDLNEQAVQLQNALEQASRSIGNLENRLINTDTEDSLINVLYNQTTGISESISSAGSDLAQTKASIENLQKRLVNSNTEGSLEDTIIAKTNSISTGVSRIKQGTDEIKTSMNQTIQSIGNLENSLVNTDTKDSLKNVLLGQAKDISSSIQMAKSDLYKQTDQLQRALADTNRTLQMVQQEAVKQYGQLHNILDSIQTELKSNHQKYLDEQYDKYEQIKTDILLETSSKSEKMLKILQISWAISGASVLGIIAVLLVLLLG